MRAERAREAVGKVDFSVPNRDQLVGALETGLGVEYRPNLDASGGQRRDTRRECRVAFSGQ